MRVFPLDEHHRIVIRGRDDLEVQVSFHSNINEGWHEDLSPVANMIRAAWWAAKWHYEKENQIHDASQ